MSFAFLYPLAWLGALAVAAPIWLHLRRKTETDVVRFSAMQFLDDQPVARARPLWPHNWPLMLLRVLALVLLIAAFTWPYIPSDRQAIVRESRVYILDNTLSHQTNGRFEEARDGIADELEKASPDTQVAVIELTAQPRLIVGFGDGRADAAAKLRSTFPSHQRGSYLAAFRMAERLLQQSLGEDRHIVFVGDSQKNQWTEGGQVPPFLKDTQVTLPEVSSSTIPNLGLAEPELQRVLAGDRAVIECVVRLNKRGDFDRATLIFHSNGEDVLQRDIEFDGQSESFTVLAQWEADPARWLRGHVRLKGKPDSLAADDQVVFSLPPVRPGRVGLLTQSPHLKTALSPEVMQGRWQAYTPDTSTSANQRRKPTQNDVLCVESHYLRAAGTRQLVEDYLEEGRGVVLLVDQMGAAARGFLQNLGIELLPASPDTAAKAGIRYMFMEHEIFQPFRSADFGDVTEITVDRYRRLKMPDALPLVFSDTGDPLVFESDLTKGRLLVFAFTLDRKETNWPLHPTFVPLLDRCLTRVRSTSTMQTDFAPGETCIWTIPAGVDATKIVVRNQDAVLVRSPVEKGQIRFSAPDQPGLYELSYDNDAHFAALFAVNPPADESILDFVDPAHQVRTWIDTPAEDERANKPADRALALSMRDVLRQDIWWWLVLGGLAALLLETSWLAIGKATT